MTAPLAGSVYHSGSGATARLYVPAGYVPPEFLEIEQASWGAGTALFVYAGPAELDPPHEVTFAHGIHSCRLCGYKGAEVPPLPCPGQVELPVGAKP